MATSKELLKAQDNGAAIIVLMGAIRTNVQAIYQPRAKGDRHPWIEVGGTTRRRAAELLAVAPKLESAAVREELRNDRQHAEYRRGLRQTRETLADNAQAPVALIAMVRRSYPNATQFEPSHDAVTGELLGYTFRESPSMRDFYGWVTLAGEYSWGLEGHRAGAATILTYASTQYQKQEGN